MFRKEKTQYLFDNIKNGDFLAFYTKPWYYLFARLIKIVTNAKMSHIGGVFDVQRFPDRVIFSFGEQSIAHDRIVEKYTILKNGQYIIDSRFRDKKNIFYYVPNKNIITESQNSQLREFWNRHKDYKVEELPFTQEWFRRIFGRKNKTYEGNCSTACRQSMFEIEIKARNDDIAPTPIEFAKFDYNGEVVIIDANS